MVMNQANAIRTAWQGQVQLLTGVAIFFGVTGEQKLHPHYAIQIVLSVTESVAMADEFGQRITGNCIVCPASVRHCLFPSGHPICVVYLEPT